MITATAVNDADNLLDLESVTKAYRLEAKQFLAVKDIDLHIKSGEFVCLLGPSGCGKSTLLRIIGGLKTTPLRQGRTLTSEKIFRNPFNQNLKGETEQPGL